MAVITRVVVMVVAVTEEGMAVAVTEEDMAAMVTKETINTPLLCIRGRSERYVIMRSSITITKYYVGVQIHTKIENLFAYSVSYSLSYPHRLICILDSEFTFYDLSHILILQ